MNIHTEKFKQEAIDYDKKRKNFWSKIHSDINKSWGTYYRNCLKNTYQHLIPKNSKVLEIGCAEGDLLASLEPSYGIGIDFCENVIKTASAKHLELEFLLSDAKELNLPHQNFDYVIFSDLANDLWDVQTVLENVHPYCSSQTRIIFNFHSHFWNTPMNIAKKLGAATPSLPQNWLTVHDIKNFLEISGYEPVRNWQEVVAPLNIPVLSKFINRFLAKIPPFHLFALANFVVARPSKITDESAPGASVIIAARNESGHIDELIERVPNMGSGTEIIFVEGGSTDDTYTAIEAAIKARPNLNCKLLKQPGKGKGDAVRAGFEVASNDILMILDADITVPPEELPRFFNLLAEGDAEFANGVRLVYPMQDNAMRFANLLGNKFFSWAFSWLLGQPIRDTLCGTKVLWRSDYERIASGRRYFGDFDPFGDFDLLFGAAKLNLKIMEVPIRYRARRYGDTNISRWSHGWLLMKMVAFAAYRIKFV